jgi:predicted DNA-binding protein
MKTKYKNLSFRLDEETLKNIEYLNNNTSINISKMLRNIVNDIAKKEKERMGEKNEYRTI